MFDGHSQGRPARTIRTWLAFRREGRELSLRVVARGWSRLHPEVHQHEQGSESMRRMNGRTELIGGAEKRAIVLVPHDPAWSRAFDRHRAHVLGALGPRALRVDHIGSTSVPGLTAKPVVDIDLSVTDPDDEGAYLVDLLVAGYELRVREPGHRLVRTPARDVHVHVCAAGSSWERRHLLFRDWLRRDAADREAYATLKRRLARREWPTMNHYADAKGALIAEITERAEAWAADTGWSVDPD